MAATNPAIKNILAKAKPVSDDLDKLILQMETTLGKKPSASPFAALYSQYNFSTEEKKTEEPKKADGAKKEKAPKAAKGEKKPAQPKGGAAAAASDLPEELEVWSKCDLRVGKIVECTVHPESEKLYIEKIDLGEPNGKIRTIGSGLQQFCTMEDMTTGLCVVFANLKPKKLGGVESEGMVMCGQNEEHTKVELMRPPEGSEIGDRIQLEGHSFPEECQAVLNPKRKVEGKLLPLLKTNDKCEGLYNGIKMVTAKGGDKPMVCKSVANGNIG
jgi:methionine--tRNA ligase beta chain